MMTDIMFRCASRRLARSVSARGSKVFLYSFEEGTAFHADELMYVFENGDYANNTVPTIPGLVDSVQAYWTNFAISDDPNGVGLVQWPVYDEATDQHIILKEAIESGSNLQKDACDYWDAYLINGS